MSADLIQRLRTCSEEERRAVAIQLGHTRSDEAVIELIRMIEGRHRKGLKWYNVNEQFVGIEALGETARENALNYLKWLNVCTISSEGTSSQSGYNYSSYEVGTYKNARKGLREALTYRLEREWSCDAHVSMNLQNESWAADDLSGVHQLAQRADHEGVLAKIKKMGYPHNPDCAYRRSYNLPILLGAIQKLEQTVKDALPNS